MASEEMEWELQPGLGLLFDGGNRPGELDWFLSLGSSSKVVGELGNRTVSSSWNSTSGSRALGRTETGLLVRMKFGSTSNRNSS